jgi:two-component system response regulator YesN
MDWRVKKVIDATTVRYGESHLSLTRLSGEIGVSTHYLGNLFKRDFGLSFHTYLRRLRIQKACELLADPAKLIKQISHQTGYTRVANFDRDFRAECGMTPKQYRVRLVDTACAGQSASPPN